LKFARFSVSLVFNLTESQINQPLVMWRAMTSAVQEFCKLRPGLECH
ncbi:MAG: hypothetical protein JWP29_2453, partial [Rhodoferax sp.]|nr:hypothetical protein [Rhodoferax sp.]